MPVKFHRDQYGKLCRGKAFTDQYMVLVYIRRFCIIYDTEPVFFYKVTKPTKGVMKKVVQMKQKCYLERNHSEARSAFER